MVKNRLYGEPDFEAKIKLLTEKEGGRSSLPFQGYRSNFIYEGESIYSQYSIWPEFLDDEKRPYPLGLYIKPYKCFANFYILDESKKEQHKNKLRTGVKFNMMEGPKIIGKGIVTGIFM